ncbi:MAG: hypothetical protein S4CHLAM20_02560 [Chlamydiia bacterium]|nr:hypothetical protein [Chlamydiia bacterium]
MKFEQHCILDPNILASIIVHMRTYFLISLLFLASCSPSTLSEWRVEGVSVVKDLVEELKTIDSLTALENKKSSIKKKYSKLLNIMIEADNYDEDESTLRPESFYSNALREQYIRLYEIEGARELLFEIQKESLHKLDLHTRSKKS